MSEAGVRLWKLGAIGGRVTDERGEPIVGVAVRLFGMRNISGRPRLVGGPVTLTDDRGVYRIANLQPGDYVVGALSSQSTILDSTPEGPAYRPLGGLDGGGYASRREPVTGPTIDDRDGRHRLAVTTFPTPPPGDNGRARAYAPMFYPSATSPANATAIALKFSEERRGVNIQMRPVAATRVTGRLDGAPDLKIGQMLRLMPVGAEHLGFGTEVATTLIEPDRTFTFLNVPEGEYTLVLQPAMLDFFMSGTGDARLPHPPGFSSSGLGVGSFPAAPGLSWTTPNDGGTAWGRMPLAVTGRDLDVVFPVHATAHVQGQLAFDGDTKPVSAQQTLWMMFLPADGDPSLASHSAFTAPGDRTFKVESLLGGRYLLNGSFGAYSVMSIAWKGRDLTDAGFDTSNGQSYDDVVVTVTDRRMRVTGTVRDAQGRPAAAAVIVFPVDRARWSNYGWNPSALASRRSTTAGAYQLPPTLPQGEYFVIAVPTSQADAWLDPTFLEAASARAARLPLRWGDTKALDLQIVDGLVAR
jgi:hypothetical protein